MLRLRKGRARVSSKRLPQYSAQKVKSLALSPYGSPVPLRGQLILGQEVVRARCFSVQCRQCGFRRDGSGDMQESRRGGGGASHQRRVGLGRGYLGCKTAGTDWTLLQHQGCSPQGQADEQQRQSGRHCWLTRAKEDDCSSVHPR